MMNPLAFRKIYLNKPMRNQRMRSLFVSIVIAVRQHTTSIRFDFQQLKVALILQHLEYILKYQHNNKHEFAIEIVFIHSHFVIQRCKYTVTTNVRSTINLQRKL